MTLDLSTELETQLEEAKSEIARLQRDLDNTEHDYDATWKRLSARVEQVELLEAEIKRLRAALERIANLKPLSRAVDPHDSQARPRRMARRALSNRDGGYTR